MFDQKKQGVSIFRQLLVRINFFSRSELPCSCNRKALVVNDDVTIAHNGSLVVVLEMHYVKKNRWYTCSIEHRERISRFYIPMLRYLSDSCNVCRHA